MRIAALDAEPSQLDSTRRTVESLGHECEGFTEGRIALQALRQKRFDLLVLDWVLPDVPGLSVVRMIRQVMLSRLPVMLLAGDGEDVDIVEGLGAGADDFMVRPFPECELAARVQALLRRAYPGQYEVEMAFGPYRFYPHSRTLHVDGRPLELKHREYDLALFLFQNMGRLLSREQLREAVWGQGPDAPSRSLDTHISRLRTKLDLRPHNGFLLSASYGLGYRLEIIGGQPPGSCTDAVGAQDR